MERVNGEWEQKKLVDELVKGRESARQLQLQLGQAAASQELQEYLLQTIMSTFANALSLLQYSNGQQQQQQQQHQQMGAFADSPTSLNGSPNSDSSAQPFKDPEQVDMNKKR